jgi:putative heme iron utilization protein
MSAIAKDKAVGAPGARFREIWDLSRTLGKVTFFVPKNGHIIEVHTEIPAGEPSKQSPFFNLSEQDGVSGHFRPDLVSSIWAFDVSTPAVGRAGIAFYDATGDQSFGIYLSEDHDRVLPAQKASFKKLMEAIAAGVTICR